jgi:beta-galactosidase
LDIVSTDSYWWPGTAHHHHRSIAWMRGLKRNVDGSPKPFWLLETTPFQIGGLATGPLKTPGFQLAEAALFTGGGTTAHLYWLWRQQRTGIESSHGAILTAWGTPTPACDEIKSVSAFFKKATPLLTGIPPATPEIAVHDPKLSKQLFLRGSSMYAGTDAQWTYRREVDDPLLAGGWWHDILPEGGDPSLYKVVLSPWMPILTESVIAQMLAWVEHGGTWIVGPASSLRDECAAVFTDYGMGSLERALGFRTLFWQQADNLTGTWGDKELPLNGLAYVLDPGGCQALGHYTSSYAKGHAWAIEKSLGAGRVVVLAAYSKGNYGVILETLLGASNLQKTLTSSAGVFLLPRQSRDGRRGYIATNTEPTDGWIEAPYAGTDLLTGNHVAAGRITIPSMGVLAVVSQPPKC